MILQYQQNHLVVFYGKQFFFINHMHKGVIPPTLLCTQPLEYYKLCLVYLPAYNDLAPNQTRRISLATITNLTVLINQKHSIILLVNRVFLLQKSFGY